MSIQIELEDDETEVVAHALDFHALGLRSARACTIEDPNVASPEMLLDLTADYDEELNLVRKVKEKLNGTAGT